MSETVGTGSTVREAYSFACLNCGHGWEQTYEIEHHVDGQGIAQVTYTADGERVPSPLTRPTCLNCEGHQLRIMRPGRVSGTRSTWGAGERARAAYPSHHRSLLHFLHIRRESGGGNTGDAA